MFPSFLRCILLVCYTVDLHIQDIVATLKASVAISSVNGHFCHKMPVLFPRFLYYGLTYLNIFYVIYGGLFSIIYLRFFITALVCDDILDFFSFLGLFCYAHRTLLDHFSHVRI